MDLSPSPLEESPLAALPDDPAGQSADWPLVTALRQGDEEAFLALVGRYHQALVRLATLYVRDWNTAEEVAQETWLDVLNGIGRFEGRSSLKTWLFRILTNNAKTRGQREGRTVPFSWLEELEDTGEPAVDPGRFWPAGHPEWPHHWEKMPAPWGEEMENWLLSAEAQRYISQAIAGLPAGMLAVITLRDVEGWSSEEICNILGVSETNQRVLLHRARSRVRQALEQYFES